MRLYLSGGGGKPFELDKRFIEDIDKTKPLMYIPIAIDTKSHPYPSCLEWMKKYFSGFNFNNIEMVTDLRRIKNADLNKYSGVYIGGGNTPFLLKELKESGFYEHLKYFIKNNVPLAGGSAGAIIFGKTIVPSLSADENKVKLNDFSALNKVGGYELWAHYDSSEDSFIREFMKKNKLEKVIAIPKDGGLFVDGNQIIFVGKPIGAIFDKKGKIELREGERVK